MKTVTSLRREGNVYPTKFFHSFSYNQQYFLRYQVPTNGYRGTIFRVLCHPESVLWLHLKLKLKRI